MLWLLLAAGSIDGSNMLPFQSPTSPVRFAPLCDGRAAGGRPHGPPAGADSCSPGSGWLFSRSGTYTARNPAFWDERRSSAVRTELGLFPLPASFCHPFVRFQRILLDGFASEKTPSEIVSDDAG